LERDIKVQDVMFQLLHAIQDLGGKLNMDAITEDEWQRYEGHFDKIVERNDKMSRLL
ncbi:lipoate--protein ligase family protein, partial [Staphylococcus haemolyticus]|nr:lipoate--protein ligase family protein [Staphylococcus haemolyticus]